MTGGAVAGAASTPLTSLVVLPHNTSGSDHNHGQNQPYNQRSHRNHSFLKSSCSGVGNRASAGEYLALLGLITFPDQHVNQAGQRRQSGDGTQSKGDLA